MNEEDEMDEHNRLGPMTMTPDREAATASLYLQMVRDRNYAASPEVLALIDETIAGADDRGEHHDG